MSYFGWLFSLGLPRCLTYTYKGVRCDLEELIGEFVSSQYYLGQSASQTTTLQLGNCSLRWQESNESQFPKWLIQYTFLSLTTMQLTSEPDPRQAYPHTLPAFQTASLLLVVRMGWVKAQNQGWDAKTVVKSSAIITYSCLVAVVGRTKVDEIRIEGRSGNSDFRLFRVFTAQLATPWTDIFFHPLPE